MPTLHILSSYEPPPSDCSCLRQPPSSRFEALKAAANEALFRVLALQPYFQLVTCIGEGRTCAANEPQRIAAQVEDTSYPLFQGAVDKRRGWHATMRWSRLLMRCARPSQKPKRKKWPERDIFFKVLLVCRRRTSCIIAMRNVVAESQETKLRCPSSRCASHLLHARNRPIGRFLYTDLIEKHFSLKLCNVR